MQLMVGAPAMPLRKDGLNPATAVEIGRDNITESWICVDCGANTAPGFPNGRRTRQLMELNGRATISFNSDSEVYYVRDHVWKKAGMAPFGGCLCIGCLEKRLGRRLKPKDFSEHIFNRMPGTARLLERRARKALRRRRKWKIAQDLGC
jgi:hypothetical protein